MFPTAFDKLFAPALFAVLLGGCNMGGGITMSAGGFGHSAGSVASPAIDHDAALAAALADERSLETPAAHAHLATPTRSADRWTTPREDGSALIQFESSTMLPAGGTLVSHWSEERTADGAITGSGTLTWTDAAGKQLDYATVMLDGKTATLGAR